MNQNVSALMIGLAGATITLSAYSQTVVSSTQCITVGLLVLICPILFEISDIVNDESIHLHIGKWFEIEFAISILNIATKLEVMVIDPHGSYYKGDGSWCELTCCDQDGNEDENPTKVRRHIREDENVDKVSYELWQERGRAPVLERLKDVKTDAKVIIL
ncbi:hypothetical protein ACLB2K_058064 [Fragaria x ananassa]